MNALRFSAVVHKIGINYAVDVPPEVSLGFGRRGYVPVAGMLNGLAIRATLVPVGGGRHRLFVNGEIRAKAGVGEGDQVEVSLSLDEAPRELPVPPELREALESNQEAWEAWEKLPPSHRKEILAYLNSLKSPEALRRNVEKAIKTTCLTIDSYHIPCPSCARYPIKIKLFFTAYALIVIFNIFILNYK